MKKVILLLTVLVGSLWANLSVNDNDKEKRCDVYLSFGDKQMNIANKQSKDFYSLPEEISVPTGLAEMYYTRYGICIERVNKNKPAESTINIK